MGFELSDLVRAYARAEYVDKEKRAGHQRFKIPVKDVFESLVENHGFPRQNVPQVCSALRSKKFLRQLGLEIEKVEGPPSQTSTTVVFHYRFQENRAESRSDTEKASDEDNSPLIKLRGLLRDELAEYGGGEAFLKWLRTDPEKDRR